MVTPVNIGFGEDKELDFYWRQLEGLMGLLFAFEGVLQEFSYSFVGDKIVHEYFLAPEPAHGLNSGMFECSDQWISTNHELLRDLWDLMQNRSEHTLSKITLRPATQTMQRAVIVCWVSINGNPILTQEWLFYRKGDKNGLST